jgi:hypothetical protein
MSTRLKTWSLRLLKWAIAVELAWLVLLNALLALPLTQDVINMIRPEKFFVRWEQAWTLYPARLHVTRAYANGNARSQVWAFEAESVSGSIALLPLILKQVWISDVEGRDLDFRMRPRPKPDRDYTAIEAWFPEIEGREVTPAVPPPPQKRWPWNISVDGIEVSGRVGYWLYNMQGSADADVQAKLNYRSGGGPLELDVHTLDLKLEPMYLNRDFPVFQQGQVRGSMGLAPFRPRENKGLELLDYLLLDVEMDIDSKSLAFVDLFLLNFEGINVNGMGQVSGHLNFDRGWVRDGTDLLVDADDLDVHVLTTEISGAGTIGLSMGQDADREMSLGFDFRDLAVQHEQEEAAFLTGEQLSLRIGGNGKIIPDLDAVNLSRTIDLELDELTVPDLALLQRYVPRKWPLTLHGGEGTLAGTVHVAPTQLQIDLRLGSDNAEMGLNQYRFETNLDAALRLDNPDLVNHSTAVDGTTIALTDAHLMRDGDRAPEDWSASLVLNRGEFSLISSEAKQDEENVVDLFRLLAEREMQDIVGESNGRFDFDATVSSLAWIGVLLDGGYRSDFSGHAIITGTANLADGLPAPGTDVTVTSDRLAVGILDYLVTGDGRIDLLVDEGGELPDWRFDLGLRDAGMRRRNEDQTYIKDVELNLAALVPDVSFEPDRERRFAMQFSIPAARITDMAVFNSHLPPDSPFRFTGGEAELTAEIALQHDDANGWLRLQADDIDGLLEDQQIEADLDLDISLVGGVPNEMFFDFSGSTVLLDGVRIAGERQEFTQEDWSAQLLLDRAETTWLHPPEMEIDARLNVSDSRPFVALFNNTGWKPRALTRAMTVEDIEGDGRLVLKEHQVRIQHARLIGDTMEIRAKGIIADPSGDGVVYARYKDLDATIRFRNGRKSLDLIKPLKKFEEYELPP